MRRVRVELLLLQLCALATASLVYVTDLPVYSSLAPCAASAVGDVIQGLTESSCPQDVTALQSCACSKDKIPNGVSSSITSYVLYSCSSTASEDVRSAAAVYSQYCSQGAPGPSTSASPTLVSQYITDLNAWSQLAPCAASGVSDAIMSLTYDLCPSGQSALESCACTKNQNSLAASERIHRGIFDACGSTHTEDVTSAQAVFAGYCAMGNGTTSFPSPGTIPGQVTYYITDLPTFSSLAPCASSALSEIVHSMTASECQSAPRDLASCACVKDQNSAFLSRGIRTAVSDYCSSTDSADITSALAVFDFYCSAAKGSVAPTGVTASETVAAPFGSPQTNGPKPSATANSPGATATAGGLSPSGIASSLLTKSTTNGALIAGAAGGAVFVALIGIGIWLWRRRRNHKSLPLPSNTATPGDGPDGKLGHELHPYNKISDGSVKIQDNTYHEVHADPSISQFPLNQPIQSQYNKLSSPSQYSKVSSISPSLYTVSPVPAYETGSQPDVPEMPGTGVISPNVLEMAGSNGRPPTHSAKMPGNGGRPPHNVPEMMGQYQQQPQYQASYSNQQVYEMDQQPHAMSYNSGPVEPYEMYTPDSR